MGFFLWSLSEVTDSMGSEKQLGHLIADFPCKLSRPLSRTEIVKEIRNIIARYDQMDWSTERAALATVVSVEQSSYRRIGARMFVQSGGNWTGGISGGCLEGDALRRAQTAIYKNEPTVVTYDTLEEDDHQIGIGLGCNGKIEVLFVPIHPEQPDNPIEVLRAQLDNRQPSILIQSISLKDHLQSKLYTAAELKRLAEEQDLELAQVQSSLDEVNRRKTSMVVELSTRAGESYDLLFEWLRPEIRLIIVGDNYDVNALVGIVHELGWEIHLVGTLRKFDKAVYQLAQTVQHYDDIQQLELDAHTCVLLMSHDYQRDLQMIRQLLPLKPAYLGMLGPRKRTLKMQAELEGEGLDLVNYSKLYSPIGLDIGAESPEEIALSIVSEIVGVYRGRGGGSLREREGSIH